MVKELYVVYECYTKKVFTNPVRINPSYGVDHYFDWLDKVDVKQSFFESEKKAARKLRKLRQAWLEEKKSKQHYRKCLRVENPLTKEFQIPNQKEFEKEVLNIFDRHYQVKKVQWDINIVA